VQLQSGARLGPYEIVALLGRGGMGEVYRAIDTRVARVVAVKVLPSDAAEQPERRQRFEREAKAVARLNHPHICTLYDVGSQDDVEFLVMEYLDGETLSARLARGPLPLDEALKHAASLAQALARAHREGIIHRDIKPSNVMLTEAGVKLLDFGLAKLRDPSTGSGHSAVIRHSPLDDQSTGAPISPEGTLVGTIAYMSPEQLEGRAVDARTDIYALGLIVYEMITGQRAFVKGSQAGLIAAILTEDPPPMTVLQPRTPPEVERIIFTALAKDPNKRWQDAGDLARQLAWVATGSHTTTVNAGTRAPAVAWRAWTLAAAAIIVAAVGTTGLVWRARNPSSAIGDPHAPIRSLVILPCLANGDAGAQAYCNGLTDTLSAKLTPLAVSRGLQLTSTLEVRQRGVDDAAKARREFGATLILEGGILRAGDTLRVNYVLVDAATLRQIDAFSVTAASGDPFALQDRVATWATGVLAMRLNAEERQTITASGTRAPGALDLYLEGRGYALDFQKPGNIEAAIDRFSRAIELDSRFALAQAGLGGALWLKYEASHDAALVPQSRAACVQALALDPASAAPHICLGAVAHGTGKFDEAVREFQLALDREPTSDEAYLGLARAQARTGSADAAEATYQRALALRPQYWAAHVWLGTYYREHARYAEAVEQYQRALVLTPDNARIYYILGGLYGSIGRYDEAIAACRKSAELQPTWNAYSNWGMTLFRMRRFEEAVTRLEAARQIGPDTYLLVGNLARATVYAGRRQEGMMLFRAAAALAEQTLAVNPGDIDARASVATYYAKLGDRAHAIANLAALPVDLADPHVLLFGAVAFADLNDRPAAFEWLDRAARHGLAANELEEWIDLDPLKNDPRFAALSAKAQH
jgi:tetratricopeptide (TPR) repeat protein/TolB-like protein/predicted Ser/Thr protein kinase